VERLHTTQQWLGDDHNAVILCEQLNRVSSGTDAQRLQRAAALYEQRLRQQALATGARIYARRPKAVVRDAALAWRASQ
jgi:hypothetical protein